MRWLKHCELISDVAASCESETTNELRGQIRDDIAKQIARHDASVAVTVGVGAHALAGAITELTRDPERVCCNLGRRGKFPCRDVLADMLTAVADFAS